MVFCAIFYNDLYIYNDLFVFCQQFLSDHCLSAFGAFDSGAFYSLLMWDTFAAFGASAEAARSKGATSISPFPIFWGFLSSLISSRSLIKQSILLILAGGFCQKAKAASTSLNYLFPNSFSKKEILSFRAFISSRREPLSP